jgi:hypothetical protein
MFACAAGTVAHTARMLALRARTFTREEGRRETPLAIVR